MCNNLNPGCVQHGKSRNCRAKAICTLAFRMPSVALNYILYEDKISLRKVLTLLKDNFLYAFKA